MTVMILTVKRGKQGQEGKERGETEQCERVPYKDAEQPEGSQGNRAADSRAESRGHQQAKMHESKSPCGNVTQKHILG